MGSINNSFNQFASVTQQSQLPKIEQSASAKIDGYPKVDKKNICELENIDFKPKSTTKSKITRAIAGVCTLGVSEGLRKGMTMILFGSGTGKKERLEGLNQFRNNHTDFDQFAERVQVTSPDGTKIDGMIIKPQKANIGENNQEQWVVKLNGMGECYELNLDEAKQLADLSGANVLVFNYRGTGESTGRADKASDWVKDSMSMVQFAKDHKGVSEENITILGHSFGGGIGAVTASRYENVRHINSRSFSSFSKAVNNFIKSKGGKNYMMRKGAGAIGKVASSAIKMIDFDVNSKKAHTWIENRTMIVHHADDKTIKKEASLYHAIEKNPTASPSSNFQGNVNDINTPLRNKIVELKTFNPKDYKTGENYNQSKTRFKETIQKYNQIANLTGTDQEIKFDEESFKTKPFVYKTDLAQKMLSIAKGDKGPGLTESVVGNIREINNFDPTWSGKQADSHLDSLVDYEETAGDIAQFINQNNIGKTSKTPKDIDISQRQKFGGNLNGDNLFVTRG